MLTSHLLRSLGLSGRHLRLPCCTLVRAGQHGRRRAQPAGPQPSGACWGAAFKTFEALLGAADLEPGRCTRRNSSACRCMQGKAMQAEPAEGDSTVSTYTLGLHLAVNTRGSLVSFDAAVNGHNDRQLRCAHDTGTVFRSQRSRVA